MKYPRFFAIADFFFGDTLFFLFFVAPLPGILLWIWFSDPWSFANSVGYGNVVNSCLTFGVGLAAIILALTRWRRVELFPSERYIVLVLLALSTSLLFAIANYQLYLADDHEFMIDTEVKSDIHDRLTKEILQGSTPIILKAQRTIDVCSTLKRLLSSPQAHGAAFVFRRDFDQGRSHEYSLTLQRTSFISAIHTKGAFTTYTDHLTTTYADLWSVEFHVGSQIVLPPPRPNGAAERLEQDVVSHLSDPGKPLLALLDLTETDARQTLDSAIAIRDRALSRIKLPLSMFVYQQAAQTLENSPDFFKPAGTPAIAISITYTVMKFIYFGLFVSVVAAAVAEHQQTDQLSGSQAP